MRNKTESKKSQSGQILIYTTIIVMLAALILVPLMQFTYSSHRSALIRTQRTLELYASDAGIEDALYQIKTEQKGTALASLPFGNTSSYNPGTPGMNDRTENVTVQKVWLPEDLPANATIPNKPGNPAKNWTNPAPVNNDTTPSLDTDKSDKLVVVGMLQTVQVTAAADDFDHGWPNGVSQVNGVNQGNWTGNWTTTGSALGNASGGNGGFCLNFTGAAGTAMREMTLPKYMQPELKFDAKASSFGSGGNASCQVSTEDNPTSESDWTTVATWASGNGTYSSFDINLYDPPYNIGGGNTTTPLWVRFNANLSTQPVAQDNFETGTWSGGSGWSTTSWTTSGPSGSASVVSPGSPNSPLYNAKLTSTGEVRRKVSLASLASPSLTFWAKTSSFGATDTASLRVSTDGTHWTTMQTFNNNQVYASYSPYTLDLSQYKGNSTFWISFLGAMGTSGSAFASDTFESGWPNSGSGWAGSWTTTSSGNGNASLYTHSSGTNYAHGGNGALQLSRSGSADGTATATRVVNISGQNSPQITFYARSYHVESSGDTLTLQVSPDNVNWTSTTIISNTTNYNNSYYGTQPFTYTVPQSLLTTGLLYVRFNASMTYSSSLENSSNGDYFYIDDINILGTPCFYFDDVSITSSGSFSVDNVWIGYQANSDDIEIAYTDPNFDLTYSGTGNDPANLDRIGVWMPPGCEYVGVVGSQTTTGLNQVPDILPATYADGTILEWDYSPTINLATAPVGNSTSVPIIWDLTFSYDTPPTQVVQGMFVWIEAHGGSGLTCLSWDKGYEVYKAVSKAQSQILGTNTQVAAYAGQGAINKTSAASYGDYVAAGAALLFDNVGDGIKRKAVNPSDPYTWVTYPSLGGFLYDGRDEITSIPSDATVTAAWLYWSAFMKTTDWQGFGSQPDTTVSFMYPMRYGPESFAASSGNLTYIVSSYAQSAQEPMDLLAHQPALTLSNMRYLGEVLGTAAAHNGNDTFVTAHTPIPSPAPNVKVGNQTLSQSGNYTIDYNTGKVTIINDNLSGQVKIDYSVSGTVTLGNSTDYTIIYDTLGQDTRYKGFTITNTQITQGKLQGTVTIDYYYAKHWVTVQHAAYDKYGTALPPAQTIVPLTDPVGHTYACFDDVTQLLTGNGTYTGLTGDGQYAVGNVTATVGGSDPNSDTRCFSGWSLIVLYESPTGQAHQFYLWDPIHNAAICPFMVQPNTDSSIQPPCIYVDPYVEAPFTLNDFYPPEGTVSGKVTYFVGEGDVVYSGDSIGFKGASQGNYTFLSGPNNPVDNVMNCLSTNGQSGIDIDTYNILSEVGNDTTANVLLRTEGDRWYLNYIILSFKTNVVPPPNYSFNVASITYQYQLGGH